MLKFISGLSLKHWLMIAGAVTCIALFIREQHRADVVADLKGANKEQAVTIAVQKDTIETDTKVDVIQDQLQTNTALATRDATRAHEVIQRNTQHQRDTIIQRFDTLPVSFENIENQHKELSSLYIDSLWESYCRTSPLDPQCVIMDKR